MSINKFWFFILIRYTRQEKLHAHISQHSLILNILKSMWKLPKILYIFGKEEPEHKFNLIVISNIYLLYITENAFISVRLFTTLQIQKSWVFHLSTVMLDSFLLYPHVCSCWVPFPLTVKEPHMRIPVENKLYKCTMLLSNSDGKGEQRRKNVFSIIFVKFS